MHLLFSQQSFTTSLRMKGSFEGKQHVLSPLSGLERRCCGVHVGRGFQELLGVSTQSSLN